MLIAINWESLQGTFKNITFTNFQVNNALSQLDPLVYGWNMEATKQEYIVLYQNMMYTSTTLKKMIKQTINMKVVAILILYIANDGKGGGVIADYLTCLR